MSLIFQTLSQFCLSLSFFFSEQDQRFFFFLSNFFVFWLLAGNDRHSGCLQPYGNSFGEADIKAKDYFWSFLFF